MDANSHSFHNGRTSGAPAIESLDYSPIKKMKSTAKTGGTVVDKWMGLG